MGALFSSPKTPAPAPTTPLPVVDDVGTARAKQADIAKRQAMGRAGTTLTGGSNAGSSGGAGAAGAIKTTLG